MITQSQSLPLQILNIQFQLDGTSVEHPSRWDQKLHYQALARRRQGLSGIQNN